MSTLCYDRPRTLNRSVRFGAGVVPEPHGQKLAALDASMKGTQVLLAFAATLALSGAGDTSRGVEALAAATGARRPAEPRFTGGFAYASCRVDGPQRLVSRSRCWEPPAPGSREAQVLQRVGARLLVEAQAAPSPSSFQAVAILRLIGGDPGEGSDEAVSWLARAVASAPGDARLWSDLAAAHLVRAQQRDDPYDLIRAFEAVQRALRIDQHLPEAWFNRALILEHLYLLSDAREAWEVYQWLDPGSRWEAEARAHLARLGRAPDSSSWDEQRQRLNEAAARGDRGTVEAVVRQFPQEARQHAELELLGLWAEAHISGSSARAAALLTTARAIGSALVATNGDRLVADTVAVLDAAGSDATRLALLAAGHRAFRDGYALYKDEAPRAAARLEEARQALAAAGSPFAAVAAYYRACCDFQTDRFARALTAFERLYHQNSRLPYPSFLGYISWMEALTRSSLGDSIGAIRSYEAAAAAFQRLGEEDNVASMHSLRGESLGQLGDGPQAWKACYTALCAAPHLRGPRALYRVFVPAAELMLQEGHEELAFAFQSEVVRQAAQLSPRTHADALSFRGLLHYRLGHSRQAMLDLRQAEAHIARQEDAIRRGRARADLSLVEGTLALPAAPRRAIGLLTQTVDFYRKVDQVFLSLAAYRARARAYRLAGDQDLAEADLQAGLEAYDRLGKGVDRQDLHLAFLSGTGELFDEMISLQAERGRSDRAFAWADHARTRVLPGRSSELPDNDRRRLLAAEREPLPMNEIRRRLPRGTAIVQYAALEDRLLIWQLRHEDWSFATVPVSRRELERLVEDARSSLQGSRRSPASARLFDLLIRPWIQEASPGSRLVFVVDKILHGLPFSCLKDRRTGRYLIEDYEIALAPSATLYVSGSRRSARPAPGREILLVGDPVFDRALFPKLPPLPEAAEEVSSIAALYPRESVRLLSDRSADKAAFLSLAPGFRRLHLAVHAVANERNPLSSMLVLAPSGGDTGVLYSWEIYQLPLEGTELVVLAACSSGSDASQMGEGIASLGRSFLAAGARRVVASLWQVDDTDGLHFFQAFHKVLLAHADPVRALREAQLLALRSPDPALQDPAAWGAFEILAASTD